MNSVLVSQIGKAYPLSAEVKLKQTSQRIGVGLQLNIQGLYTHIHPSPVNSLKSEFTSLPNEAFQGMKTEQATQLPFQNSSAIFQGLR